MDYIYLKHPKLVYRASDVSIYIMKGTDGYCITTIYHRHNHQAGRQAGGPEGGGGGGRTGRQEGGQCRGRAGK